MQAHKLHSFSVPHTYDPELRKLTIRDALVFPRELFAHADAIEILDMSGGQLHELPNDLGRLDRLRVAFFSNNPLGHVPKALSGCAALEMVGLKSCGIRSFEDNTLPNGLRGLILTDNNLTELPSSIGRLSSLQKLMLAGNSITTLPAEMASCRNLQMLRVPANKLSEVPAWLWELPNLAWYSDAANPLSYRPQIDAVKTVQWQQLQLKSKLGESAKSVVYQATMKTSRREVAVKIYGDSITTDGRPQDEMYASIIAGSHPNLIPVIGTITGAPEGRRGLVMELLSPTFSVPGLPPDLMTLTRDVIMGPLEFSVVVNALRGVCAALEHLHKQGIMHGDVYAHNILMDHEGRAYMGDLGAASLYEPSTDNGKRERLDVRSFGYLLDDILTHVAPMSTPNAAQLSNVRDSCLGYGDKPIARFNAVQCALQDI